MGTHVYYIGNKMHMGLRVSKCYFACIASVFPKRYPFISVKNLQSFDSYVNGGGNNHFCC